jgi:hypothetical protein
MFKSILDGDWRQSDHAVCMPEVRLNYFYLPYLCLEIWSGTRSCHFSYLPYLPYACMSSVGYR